MLVEEILCHARLKGPDSVHVGYVIMQFFDGFHLLSQVMSLNEVIKWGPF